MSGYNPTAALLEGVARLLADHDIGVYRTGKPYAVTDTAIIMKTMPTNPDRCIILNWTPMQSDPSLPRESGILQTACRGLPGKPLDSDRLADLCRQQLDGLTGFDLGDGVSITQCWKRNGVNMGQDESKRWVTAVQFNVDLDLPSTGLRPATGTW
ncbi:minor capsid protein [Bifidobacterium sp. ESL0784]|uniref:minor capsid protein n=1 Tax=Bifidobacterium sp. ESL0784 TaxID=2983231 RepID=UPI0023F7F347|nr:minor capsid protein [Bifidobacterium sp. ESL0784]